MLGDFMYEYYSDSEGSDQIRQDRADVLLPKHETVSLKDYRERLSAIHLDTDVIAAMQSVPWYTTWDDHEVANEMYYNGSEYTSPE